MVCFVFNYNDNDEIVCWECEESFSNCDTLLNHLSGMNVCLVNAIARHRSERRLKKKAARATARTNAKYVLSSSCPSWLSRSPLTCLQTPATLQKLCAILNSDKLRDAIAQARNEGHLFTIKAHAWLDL